MHWAMDFDWGSWYGECTGKLDWYAMVYVDWARVGICMSVCMFTVTTQASYVEFIILYILFASGGQLPI